MVRLARMAVRRRGRLSPAPVNGRRDRGLIGPRVVRTGMRAGRNVRPSGRGLLRQARLELGSAGRAHPAHGFVPGRVSPAKSSGMSRLTRLVAWASATAWSAVRNSCCGSSRLCWRAPGFALRRGVLPIASGVLNCDFSTPRQASGSGVVDDAQRIGAVPAVSNQGCR